MRVRSFQLIKSCGTRTDPAVETKSIGYRPTLGCLCFCRAILTISSWNDTFCQLIGTGSFGQLHHDETLFVHLSGLCKNKSNRDTDVNKTIPPAVSLHGYQTRTDNWGLGFCKSPRQFYRYMTNPAHLPGPRRLDNFIVTWQLPSVNWDWQKPCR